MKSVLLLTIFGLFNPRYYMEALNIKRKYLIALAIIAILGYTSVNLYYMHPVMQQISKDFDAITTYIPDYQMENQQLTLPFGTQPIYYNSPFVQFIIDDKLEAATFTTDTSKLEQLSNDVPLLILLGKQEGILRLNQHYMPFNPFYQANASPQEMKGVFHNMTKLIPIASFISNLLLSTFQYLGYLIIIATLASFFNRRLSQPFTFKMRFRIVLLTSFIPSVLLNILSFIFPLLTASPIPLAIMTLYTIFVMLMDHTKFIKENLPKQ